MAQRIRPEVVEAFKAGDYVALHLALGLKPWEASPLDVGRGPVPAYAGDGPWAESWPRAQELRRAIEEAIRAD
jgi:hypothetical protein